MVTNVAGWRINKILQFFFFLFAFAWNITACNTLPDSSRASFASGQMHQIIQESDYDKFTAAPVAWKLFVFCSS